MTYSYSKNFQLIVRSVVSVASIGAASAALFLIGFHVIPVFADKAPHIFAEQSVAEQLVITSLSEKKKLP